MTIPKSVKVIEQYAFCICKKLKRVSFQEGSNLGKIGQSCFRSAGIERIVIPKGVVEIESYAFNGCRNLKEVVFEKESKLKKIGDHCFTSTSIEAITLPKALKEICYNVFECCANLKVVYVEDGCEASLCGAKVSDSVKVGPPLETIIGNMRVWDLRKLKDIVIPNGIERIGN